MLIYHSCRLRAAVTSCAIEIEGGDAVLAEGAAVGRFGCVISHISIVVLPRSGFGALGGELSSRKPKRDTVWACLKRGPQQ